MLFLPLSRNLCQFQANERQNRVQSVQCLNGGLFIHTENGGVLRWIQVQADDIGCFALELGIITGHVSVQPMRFQLRLHPHALHRRFAHSQHLGQFSASPMGAAVGRLLQGAAQDASLHGRCHHSRSAALVPWLETLDPVLFKASAPAGDRGRTRIQLFFDLAVTQSIRERQNQPRTKHITRRQGARLRPAHQFFPFVVGEDEQVAILCHAH